MDCVVTPLKTLMGFSVHLNVQLKFYNLPFLIELSIFARQHLVMMKQVAGKYLYSW